ncbi:MAG: efflux RND transporter periplasmic adaptor subunit [Gemmatimonadota bacterium]|nr:efflux RND transporter periplasmic adaptor subunit [Gemmatimonadota bacterium]
MSRASSILISIAIIVFSVGLAALLVSLSPEPTRTEQPPQIPFVQTGPVAAGSGPIPIFGSGTVRPGAEVDIVPQVGGRVVWVDPGFKSGGRVTAGQSMFRIEEVHYRFRVQEAEAILSASRVALLKEQEQASIARSQYELYAGKQGDEASPSDTNPLTLREPQLNAARAALNRDEARLADARLALSRTRITAPFNGLVREESVDRGQIVNPGQPVGRLFAADAVEVVVPLTDAAAALVPDLWLLKAGDGNRDVGARVFARHGDAKYDWEGYVDRAEAALDEQTRTIDVIVRVPDPFSAGVPANGNASPGGHPPLMVGKFVLVEIEGMAPERYFRIPRASLKPGDEVWMVKGGVVDIVPVRVLQRSNDEAYVTGSLEHGLGVITGGIHFATEGMPVQTETDGSP